MIERGHGDPAAALKIRHLARNRLEPEAEEFRHIATPHRQVEVAGRRHVAKVRNGQKKSCELLVGGLGANRRQLRLGRAELPADLAQNVLGEGGVLTANLSQARDRNCPDGRSRDGLAAAGVLAIRF